MKCHSIPAAQRCIGGERRLLVLVTKDSHQRRLSHPSAVIFQGGQSAVNFFRHACLPALNKSDLTDWFQRPKHARAGYPESATCRLRRHLGLTTPPGATKSAIRGRRQGACCERDRRTCLQVAPWHTRAQIHKPISVHTLRHSIATHLLFNRVDIR